MTAARVFRSLAAALLAAFGVGAAAHDTWFEALASSRGEANFALGTGNRFPLSDQGVDAKFFSKSGCRSADGKVVALETLRYTEKNTRLRARPADASQLTCFVQLDPRGTVALGLWCGCRGPRAVDPHSGSGTARVTFHRRREALAAASGPRPLQQSWACRKFRDCADDNCRR